MRIMVAGGSLGGLNAALWLSDTGCDVEVYERSRSPLEGRGAGIVLHPATVKYFTHHRTPDITRIGAQARWVRYLDRRGTIAHEEPCRYRFTSWTALYGALLGCFPRGRYHLGAEVVGFEQDPDGVTVQFASGRHARGDALVCADGVSSPARRILVPEATPQYAGYVGWRGTIEELSLGPETSPPCGTPSPISCSRMATFSRTRFQRVTSPALLAATRSIGSGTGTSPRARISKIC